MSADDTALCSVDSNLSRLEVAMNLDLKQLFDWSVVNRLSLNADKTKCTLYHSKHQKNLIPLSVYLGGTQLNFVPCYEYLGFLLDNHLSFNNHVVRLIQRVNAKSILLYKIRRYLNQVITL